MIFHFTIFFWTVVFFLGLEAVASNPIELSWSGYLVSILPLVLIACMAAKRLTKRFSDAFLPGLLAFTVPTLLLLVDHRAERQVLILISALMYYFALLGVYRLRHAPQDQTAQAFLNAAALAAIFFFYAGAYGFYLNFSFPLWGIMLFYFFGTALVSYETFIALEREERRRMILYSVLLGLALGEMIWIMSFWPFGYLTTAALGLVMFFILWEVAFDVFRQTLSLRKAVFHFIFLFILMAFLIASSPWRILV